MVIVGNYVALLSLPVGFFSLRTEAGDRPGWRGTWGTGKLEIGHIGGQADGAGSQGRLVFGEADDHKATRAPTASHPEASRPCLVTSTDCILVSPRGERMGILSRLCGTKEEPLVTRKNLEELIDSIDELKPHRAYIKRRWIGMVMWWHTRSVKARWKYFSLRTVVIAGGVVIPVLTTFLSMRTGWQEGATVAIAVVGAIVAGCAAWEGVANYGEIWREKRRSAELLKVEGWQFLQLCGKYQPDKEHNIDFPRFVSEVEGMIPREVGEYLGVFDPSLAQAKKAAESILNAVVEEATKRIRQP
jgi:hypothetical protein